MIEVGTKLGGKYFVVTRQERIAVGDRFEVRTAQGEVRWAQWLHDEALTASQVAALRVELSQLPAHPRLRTPDELVTSPGGIPAAIFFQPPPRLLTEVTAGLKVAAQEDRRLVALRTVINWFAGLAETLGTLHGARTTHGALSLPHLAVTEEGEGSQVLVTGFGIEPARRLARGGARPTPRSDLSAVVLTLQKLFDQLGVKLGGAALVRWDVLRNCARAGDHTALTHGAALSQALRDLATEEEAVYRAKSATPKNPVAPSVAPAIAEAPRLSARTRRIAVIAVIGLVAVGVALRYASNRQAHRTSTGASSQTSLASANCGGEPMRPAVGVALPSAVAEVGAACRGGATLAIVARGVSGLYTTQRPARRGDAFRAPPHRLAEAALAVSLLNDEPDPWVAWSNPSGAPFSAAHLGEQPEVRSLSQGAWRAESFRGVWLLRAEPDALWIASNFIAGGAPRAVVLRLPTASSGSPEAFSLGEISILAAIGGPAATLLVQEGAALRALTVATNALSVLSADASGPDPAGGVAARAVSTEAMPRSEPWRLPTRWVLAASAGVGVPGGARHFALTAGDEPLPEGCVGAPCGARGVVYALAFADRGPPTVTRVGARGLALSITLDPDGQRWISGWGARAMQPTVWSLPDNGVSIEHALTATDGPTTLSSCGDEQWIARSESDPSPRLIASPLPCALLGAR